MSLTATESYYETRFHNRTRYLYSVLNKFIIVFPLWLLFFAEFIKHFSDSTSSILKLLVWLLMFSIIFINNKINKVYLLISLLFFAILLINLPHTFNINAGLEELIRFLFMPVVLYYGYIYRKKIDLLITTIILMALISNLFQIYVYVHGFLGVGPDIIDLRTKDGGYFLNTSFIGISNAILNLISFLLVLVFKEIKFRSFLIPFFFIFTFLTFSYKTIPFLLLGVFLFNKVSLKNYILIFISILLSTFYLYDILIDMYDVLIRKIDVYIVIGNSARYESYRVMYEFLSGFKFLGEGLGSFGGPSSVTYGSPIYDKYNFNWFYTTNIATTDTYYPHLFVELSWIGGMLFLLFLFIPILRSSNKQAKKLNLFILGAFLFESLFSFGLNNLFELICTVLLLHGINYKYNRIKYAQNTTN
jgi:hypothetical protein